MGYGDGYGDEAELEEFEVDMADFEYDVHAARRPERGLPGGLRAVHEGQVGTLALQPEAQVQVPPRAQSSTIPEQCTQGRVERAIAT
eukprot:13135116-Heterocapsa_arctica.AAC.1